MFDLFCSLGVGKNSSPTGKNTLICSFLCILCRSCVFFVDLLMVATKSRTDPRQEQNESGTLMQTAKNRNI